MMLYMNYYSRLRWGENDYLEMNGKCDLWTSRKDPDYPRFAADLKWMKAERMGGRKAGKVELGEEVFGRENSGDTGNHKHINFREGKDFHFNSTSILSLTMSFYRNTRKGVTVRRRFVTFIVRII